MEKQHRDFFALKNNFKETEDIQTLLIKKGENNTAFFTVAISTHKRADLLKETIDSVLSQQGFDDFSILIVDDNPERNDESEHLIMQYSDERISYYKNTRNMGMSGTWNRLFSLAQSENVILLHDDDMLYPDALPVMKSVLEQTKSYYAAYCSTYMVYDMQKMTEAPVQPEGSVDIVEMKTMDFIWGNIAGPPSGVCFRRQAILDMGGFSKEFDLNLDYDFYVKLSHYYPICRLDKHPLLIYRIKDNVSAKKETLLAMAYHDTIIRKGIVQDKSFIKRSLWSSFLKVHAFRIIESLKHMYHNHEFDTREEFKKMGMMYNKFDSLIYKIMMRRYFKDKI
ncbi:glycosyltransferase family 2 protein [Dysgonomonas macrotermitis]|uniref:Glycosyl transferase family 2 n=1 Tax=Dysgonomonas macrotermitis TaxID=1346286 RepID=A0A1M4WPQ0_9BACT|nr:glycosyltransferase family 2 protein [Dysgonomonas macrotermitis]SHE83033.1 Glycosyl transferase family 2 [Dysgonomonas macrotermitis]